VLVCAGGATWKLPRNGAPVSRQTATPAAKNAALKWRYKAATMNGLPIATNVTIQDSFGGRNQ